MSDELFAKNYLHDLASLLPKLDARRLGEAIATMRKVRDEGKTIFICGNGEALRSRRRWSSTL